MRITIAVLTVLLSTAPPEVPEENVTQGSPPAASAAEAGAKELIAAIAAGDPARARGFFFPADAFDLVKDLPVPARYHRKLVGWYDEDIMKEHRRFRKGDWRFEKLELGRCRWKEKGTEGNKLPYWSCRGNFVTATDGNRKRRFEIRVLINWGRNWYVTHLGPIR